jgi:hypothetical protein
MTLSFQACATPAALACARQLPLLQLLLGNAAGLHVPAASQIHAKHFWYNCMWLNHLRQTQRGGGRPLNQALIAVIELQRFMLGGLAHLQAMTTCAPSAIRPAVISLPA